MKPREATESLVKILRDYAYTSADDWNALETAKEALEKQVPKKPIPFAGVFRDCPVCEAGLINYEGDNYCYDCGQRLDWNPDEN